ncbi:MAG: hypothetical protein DRR19_21250 [Candidatus Parabeggiatoa sp. nov. 1]|nr:MAG: hypothetical protein DRR19_21250 [Gammaproteobacteria bacterium]
MGIGFAAIFRPKKLIKANWKLSLAQVRKELAMVEHTGQGKARFQLIYFDLTSESSIATVYL